MKKAFDQNVSRAKPRLKLGAPSVDPVASEAREPDESGSTRSRRRWQDSRAQPRRPTAREVLAAAALASAQAEAEAEAEEAAKRSRMEEAFREAAGIAESVAMPGAGGGPGAGARDRGRGSDGTGSDSERHRVRRDDRRVGSGGVRSPR
jgi:hypothetical protein